MTERKRRATGRARSRPGVAATGGVRVIHSDADVVVVDKPAGLLTIGTDRERRRTLQAQLSATVGRARDGDRVFIVHRLDRDASGLLVFARSPRAKAALQEQFRLHEAGRVYWAVVAGSPAEEQFTLRSHLAETSALNVYSTRDRNRGRLAVTHVRVLGRRRGHTLVEARLETGRKHQIRVQLAEAGHSILGDRRYGPERPEWHRLALHGRTLAFRHPGSGEWLEFHSEPPRGFAPGWTVRETSDPDPRSR